jgi:hypothetical protein
LAQSRLALYGHLEIAPPLQDAIRIRGARRCLRLC